MAARATGTRSPAGAKMMAESSGTGGRVPGVADRRGAELPGELPGLRPAGQHVHLGALGDRDLRREVGAGAEAVDAQPTTGRQLGAQQGPVADDAGAQQRSCLLVGEAVRQSVGECLWHHGELGVAAVGVPPGVARLLAEVLPTGTAETAYPAGVAQPRDADPVPDREPRRVGPARHHVSHHLVPGDGGGPTRKEVALGQVQVGATDPADTHAHEHLLPPRRGERPLHRLERPLLEGPGPGDGPGAHPRLGHVTLTCAVDRFEALVDIGSSLAGMGQAESPPTVQSTPPPEPQTVALVPVPATGLRASWSHG